MLLRVYEFRNEVTSFLKSKDTNIRVFQDAAWLSSFTFLVDHIAPQQVEPTTLRKKSNICLDLQ